MCVLDNNFLDRTNYALGIARGMNYLHSCNVLHLDLTPKAVLVDHGTCKVAEYGLGKLATKLCLVPTSPTGATPAYMVTLEMASLNYLQGT